MTTPAEQLRPPAIGGIPGKTARPFSFLVEWLCRKLFAFVRVDPTAVERVRALASRGAIVYVMRHRSWVDYALVTYVLMREGLPTPQFASGLSPFLLRPVRELLRELWRRARTFRKPRELHEFEERERFHRLVREGRSVVLFMRSGVPAVRRVGRRRRTIAGTRTGSDFLREVVHRLWDSDQEAALVPVAVFRGRGMRRKESRFGTLVYSVQEMPGEARRLVSLLWNVRDTSISIGAEVRLRDFMQRFQHEGEERIVRRLARALQIFLYREERLVWGPPLLPKRMVRQRVLEDEEVVSTISRLATETGQTEMQLWKQAERYFNEMAANFHGLYFSILEFGFNRIWPRVFQGLEYSGLEKVVERVKQHPVVLVPCHRSHFDYLILSYLFHLNYLSPPHIAAGINLSFWPLGPLFRGAGAYFIRRSFEGNELYKTVFRAYLTFLIREGYTQEFFIEGGRSRTGKILTPKLGMLSAIVDAFARGVRRDLYLVPVSIHYGRVVEEEAYGRELGGAEKEPESLSALLRAGRVLRQRHGTVYITFGEPLSLEECLGEAKPRFRAKQGLEVESEKRRFVRKLGFRLLREVNAVAVAGATSVSSSVLLSLPNRACRQRDFVRRALALAEYLKSENVRFTSSLERNAVSEFRESLGFLESGGLIQRLPSDDGDVIYVPTEKRLALDFYKNNGIHFFLFPTLVTEALLRGLRGEALVEDVTWWLDLFRWEFALPEREAFRAGIERVISYLHSAGALSGAFGAETLHDHPFTGAVRGILDNFRESYWIAARTLARLPESGLPRKTVIERMRRTFRTSLLLGEVRKPEGNSAVTFGNALDQFAERSAISMSSGKGKGKEPLVRSGDEKAVLTAVANRIGSCLMSV
jgi:glycerol-3-phosphate O-acyltransferase